MESFKVFLKINQERKFHKKKSFLKHEKCRKIENQSSNKTKKFLKPEEVFN